MNNECLVHVENLEPLPKKFEATYLGNEINKDANNRHEILNKMQEVRQTWFKSLPYWKATNANVKWQLLICDAVVRSRLLCGLETIHLTNAMQKNIYAFQLRCFRKTLKVPSTFIDRRNTNREVLNRCAALAYPNRGDRREFELFSQSYLRRKSKIYLLGHVLRASHDDPLRQISFQPDCALRVSYGKKTSRSPETKLAALRQKTYF